MIIIENDDDIYIAWIEANPNGFVVNTQNPPRLANASLHRASCKHIATPERSNWTTSGYIRICSNSLEELKQWSRGTIGEIADCGLCFPAEQTIEERELGSLAGGVALPFDSYPAGGRRLLGRRSITNSRRGYGLELRRLTNQTKCVYCGLDIYSTYETWLLLQVDHVVPSTMGKRLMISTDWLEDYSNLVLACSGCNSFANQFDDKSVVESPGSLDEFYNLRNRIFRSPGNHTFRSKIPGLASPRLVLHLPDARAH